jgi:hypothetical protein
MASIHRRTVRWITQGGHQRTDPAAGKETLRTYATGWARIRSPLKVPAASASAAACATGTTKSPPGCTAKATDPPPQSPRQSQQLTGT